ncbi:hypothetical protein EJ08DRAFT_649702 [Tothia fuscella]|uniref:Uncharacterized protein n=1 Tax=Tothia fuscella TaxID=1048955 RepID=A0A9P4TXJ5_9PEZI|nr:hypothetical protein EJ08DRAFT_649702 [Tothia fuscella]
MQVMKQELNNTNSLLVVAPRLCCKNKPTIRVAEKADDVIPAKGRGRMTSSGGRKTLKPQLQSFSYLFSLLFR